MKKAVLLLLCCFGMLHFVMAQNPRPQEASDYVYPQKFSPEKLDNYLFSAYYVNSKKVYNLKQAVMSKPGKMIKSLKINPAGSSYALLFGKGKNMKIEIYDLWTPDKRLVKIKLKKTPICICYSPDSKYFVVADSEKWIRLFDTRDYTQSEAFAVASEPEEILVSPDNCFLALISGNAVQIWNLKTRALRTELSMEENVNGCVFSDDNKSVAVLTSDGRLHLYDTVDFLPLQTFDALGAAKACDITDDGKYIAVVTGDKRIAVINKMDNRDRTYMDNAAGGITDVKFVKNGAGQSFLMYNTSSSIVYKSIEDFSPYYTKMLSEELDERMEEWMQRMPGESLSEYNERVNEQTRMQQIRLFEEEIATRMADNLLAASEVTMSNFNPQTNTLEIDFNTMPSIYLDVPSEKIGDFMTPDNLEFRNALYGLTETDKFELVYVDVYNKNTGEKYTFDNRERKSLDYMKMDDNFLPLEFVHLSNTDERRLNEIRENVIDLAKKSNTISDNTDISVNAGVVSDVAPDGSKILNYRIGFSYNVEKDFSAKEDFAPGKYNIEQSGAAMSMVAIIKTAFEEEFAQYVRAGKKLRINITGMADRLPINGIIPYDGIYGDFVDEPVYGDDLYAITVTEKTGITQNDQLAFLRALGVKGQIEKNIQAITDMDVAYRYNIRVADKTGGEYRRISVDFVFVDAF